MVVGCRFERSIQNGLNRWKEENPQRAETLTAEEWDELYSIFGVGGPLTMEGVEHFVSVIERRRKLIAALHVLAGTHHLAELETIMLGMLAEADVSNAKYEERKPACQ
jgi:hypothetical protein